MSLSHSKLFCMRLSHLKAVLAWLDDLMRWGVAFTWEERGVG